jgi:malonyl-CoA O-methyltransferase
MLRALAARMRPRPAPPELEPLPAYNLWAATYPDVARNPLMQAEELAVHSLLAPGELTDRRALDLACGAGRYLYWLEEAGAAFAVGLDFSSAMLARAGGPLRRLAQADLQALPLAAGSFDIVVCGLAVGHLPGLAPALREMARVLRPGGVAVYSDFHPYGDLLGWKRTFRAGEREYAVRHHRHLYADHVAACRRAGLSIEAVREPIALDEHGRRAWGDVPAALVVRAVVER